MMDFVVANRACGILYRFLKSYPDSVFLIPANVCPVVPLTFLMANVDFIFVDIDKDTLCIDEREVLNKLRNHDASGLLFVRSYGFLYDTNSFFETIKKIDPNIPIIDDRCLCQPILYFKEQRYSSSIDLILYSTGYAKQVDLGYGAYGFVSDMKRLEHADLDYSQYDIDCFYKEKRDSQTLITDVPSGWLDTRIVEDSDIVDKYCLSVKKQYEKVFPYKRKINSIYREFLPEECCLGDEYNQWRFNIRVKGKNYILKKIFESGLFASSHYYPASLLFNNVFYAEASQLFEEIINLNNDFYMDEYRAEKLARLIKENI